MPAMHGMLSFLAGQKLEDINDILVAVDPDNAGGKLVNKNFWIIWLGGRGRIETSYVLCSYNTNTGAGYPCGWWRWVFLIFSCASKHLTQEREVALFIPYIVRNGNYSS